MISLTVADKSLSRGTIDGNRKRTNPRWILRWSRTKRIFIVFR